MSEENSLVQEQSQEEEQEITSSQTQAEKSRAEIRAEKGFRTFQDVKKLMTENFNSDDYIQSTALDILSLYFKGQKILYIESKVYCEGYLYRLMLPAILISSICSAISGIFKDYPPAATLVCVLAALNSFILTLVTYLKLDAKAEAHKSSAYSFEQLQTICEFNSGKILLTLEDNKKICTETLEETEEKVMEIKQKNQFTLPEAIRYNYPVLYSTNIFSELKQIQNKEMILINNLKVIMNNGASMKLEIEKAITIAKKEGKSTTEQIERQKEEKRTHYIEKNKAINDVISFRKEYHSLTTIFNDEINANIEKKRNMWCKFGSWLRT